jgi:hypothetical protein
MKSEVSRKSQIKIPSKFISEDFVSYLSCLLPLDESELTIRQRQITGEGSLSELANDFQLLILHSIDLVDILMLLKNAVCVEIHKKENYIQYDTQGIVCLRNEIRAKIQ